MIILNKEYPAEINAIRDIHEDLKSCLKYLKYNDAMQDPFLLSTSEILTNALKHAQNKPSSFKISLIIKSKTLILSIMDDGEDFNDFDDMHNASKDKYINTKQGNLVANGLGLYLSGKGFDNFTYHRVGEWNQYHLSTSFPSDSKTPHI